MRAQARTTGDEMRGIYDFETYDWTKPLCCGLLVSDSFTFIHELPRHSRNCEVRKVRGANVALRTLWEMAYRVRRNDVAEWWAHNGGGFDALILLQEAIVQGWVIKAVPANGRIIHMEIVVVMPDGAECIVTLKDSYAVVQSSLEKAAKDFALGISKTFDESDYDKGDMRQLPISRLRLGCEQDCRVLARLLDTVESLLTRHGGALKSTFSSSALSVVKATLRNKKMKMPEIPPDLRWVNETARQAFYGGRVEVFHHNPKQSVTEYDVLSSYPYAMSKDLPWRFMSRNERGSNAWEDCDGFGYFHVEVPDMEIPPLPYRDKDGGLFFPIGSWNGWFAYNEIRYAREKCGVRIQPIETYNFTTEESPFADFVIPFYEEKKTATGAVRMLDKLLLNGGYGKFAQKPEKETLYVFQSEEEGIAFIERGNIECRKLDGSYRCITAMETQWAKHTHYPIAAYITADARIRLHALLSAASRVAYADTDSVHAIVDSAALGALCGTELGNLERKGTYARAEYFAPKLYRVRVSGKVSSCGKSCNGTLEPHWHNANKGFTIAPVDFARIVNGEAIIQERMQKAKSQLKTGGVFAREKHMKLWRGKSAKRQPLRNGETVPWHVKELLDGKHKTAVSPMFKNLRD